MNIEEINSKKDKMRKWLSIGAMAAIGLIVSPVIFLAIGGMIGLAVAAGLGFAMVSFAPWVALKIANAKYRAIEAEKVAHIQQVQAAAAANPIETMQNLLQQKNIAFKEFKISVETAITAHDTFATKCEKFAKNYPQRAPEFQKQLNNMAKMVTMKKEALKEARRTLEDGSLKLEEMQAYWDMSKDAQALNKAAGMDTGDVFEKLKADTACDAVFESMTRAFAQLEVAALLAVDSDDRPSATTLQLANSESIVLDIPSRVVRETVKRG